MPAVKQANAAVVVFEHESTNVRTFDLAAADAEAAESIGVVLAGSLKDRVGRLVQVQNTAARLAVEAGYLLLSIKAESDHGSFQDGLDAIGLSRQRAAELMRMAKFVTQLAPDQRTQLLKLNKSKLMALSMADADAVQSMLEDGQTDVQVLSFRALQRKLNDTEVQLEKQRIEAEGLRKRLREASSGSSDKVPPLMAEIRSRIALLSQQMVGVADGMRDVHATLTDLTSSRDDGDWTDPTLRLGLAACAHMQTQVDGVLRLYLKALPEGDYAPVPQCQLKPGEVKSLTLKFQDLIATQQLHTAQHVARKTNAQRSGPGRPSRVPEAAKVAKGRR